MPKTVEEAHALDEENGNGDDWRKAIQKEMNNNDHFQIIGRP
jgi:hypothetical protein